MSNIKNSHDILIKSKNTYYKLVDDDNSIYFVCDRVFSEENFAAVTMLVSGVVENGISLKVETLADIHGVKIAYSVCTKLVELKKVDFILETLPIIVSQWQQLIEDTKGQEVFNIPKREQMSRNVLRHLFGEQTQMRDFVKMR